ncbi:MAG: aminoglycoside 3-N-acetyltransferase [Anaerolineae bacterium]|nr:aminoglycoside 3-N-acetyltransferase [Anaerolineae bacterium]
MTTTDSAPLHTRSQLINDVRSLGVQRGQVIMLHASVRAVGKVMGGANVILQALLEALTPAGTLMMYAGWNDIPDFVLELPPDLRQVYYQEHPPFDPAIARSVRDYSILAEFLRTFPATQRSLNPEASMVANGARAAWITADHPLNYGYGAGSPLAKLVEAQGSVLLLGSPLDNITLLHYAEYRAKMRQKNVIHYQCPILRDGKTVWVDIEDYSTGDPHDDYSFEQIVLDYLAQGKGRRGTVGSAQSYLFEAADLADFAISWLESRFG